MSAVRLQHPLGDRERTVVRCLIGRYLGGDGSVWMTLGLSHAQQLLMKYETHLQQIEEQLAAVQASEGAKAIALDEIRERVATGRWT